MQLLLDTQVLIWFVEGNPQLPSQVKELITNGDNDIFVSQASLFEIIIKIKIGKLSLKRGLQGLLHDLHIEAIEVLTISNGHLFSYEELPLFDDHRDPFDRLILATALHEKWPIISADHKFSWYKDQIEVIW